MKDRLFLFIRFFISSFRSRASILHRYPPQFSSPLYSFPPDSSQSLPSLGWWAQGHDRPGFRHRESPFLTTSQTMASFERFPPFSEGLSRAFRNFNKGKTI